MKSLWRFLSLLSSPRSVVCQVRLVQSGETLTLTSAVSGESITDGTYCWDWVRSSSAHCAPSLQGRVTDSADTAKNQVSLKRRSLTAADTATCYCARRAPQRGSVHEGGAVSMQGLYCLTTLGVSTGQGSSRGGVVATGCQKQTPTILEDRVRIRARARNTCRVRVRVWGRV
uniref:Immunoglobulin V-set domain-containing protein n=1 Tax=Gopherus agassizii TaxID=38772 RepID=A0A452H717_9SAUR